MFKGERGMIKDEHSCVVFFFFKHKAVGDVDSPTDAD